MGSFDMLMSTPPRVCACLLSVAFHAGSGNTGMEVWSCVRLPTHVFLFSLALSMFCGGDSHSVPWLPIEAPCIIPLLLSLIPLFFSPILHLSSCSRICYFLFSSLFLILFFFIISVSLFLFFFLWFCLVLFSVCFPCSCLPFLCLRRWFWTCGSA